MSGGISNASFSQQVKSFPTNYDDMSLDRIINTATGNYSIHVVTAGKTYFLMAAGLSGDYNVAGEGNLSITLPGGKTILHSYFNSNLAAVFDTKSINISFPNPIPVNAGEVVNFGIGGNDFVNAIAWTIGYEI